MIPSNTFTSPLPLLNHDDDNNDEAHDYDDDKACNVKSLGPLAFAGVKRSLQYKRCVWD